MGFSGLLGAVWPGSPPKGTVEPLADPQTPSLGYEPRSSSEEDSLAALDMTLDVDPDLDTLALAKASRAHDWVANTMPTAAPMPG